MRISLSTYRLLLGVLVLHFGPAIAQTQLDPPVSAHPHSGGRVLWEHDLSLDGDTAHNHMWARSFGGWGDYANDPYSAYGCWNNDDFLFRALPVFDLGHCYVDTIEPMNIITYSFAGSGWDADEKDVVRYAFGRWSGLASLHTFAGIHGVQGNRIGIGFSEVPVGGKISVTWEDMTLPGLGSFNPVTYRIRFNSNSSLSWDTSTTIPEADPTKYHLLTVALHEIGHSIGLDHQLDGDDLMLEGGQANPAPDPRRHIHVTPDIDSEHGAYELYGQPPGQSDPGMPDCNVIVERLCGLPSGLPNLFTTVSAHLPGYSITNVDIDYQNGISGPWNDLYEGEYSCPGMIASIVRKFRLLVETTQGLSMCEIVVDPDNLPIPNCGGGGPGGGGFE